MVKMSSIRQYNSSLDFIKGIACIFVVFMHCEFPGVLETVVQAVSRFCVPLFFIVSGYFCFKRETRTVADSLCKIKHIAKIAPDACIFYVCFSLLLQYLSGGITLSVSVRQLYVWLLFNSPFWVAGQYWFLFALLYTYVFYFAFELNGKRKWAYCLAAIMFVAYYLLAQCMHIAGIHVPNHIYRNWLVEGFAYFMLGHWIHEHQARITIDNRTLLLIIITSTLLCLPERYLLGRDFGVNFCTLPQVVALYIYAVQNPTSHQGYLQQLGKTCSMFVYILHPAVWHSMEKIYYVINVDTDMTALYLMPVIVLVLTILLSIACYREQQKFLYSKTNA
jgi:surface polysaccharide O-acyltransferase-like enzyme